MEQLQKDLKYVKARNEPPSGRSHSLQVPNPCCHRIHASEMQSLLPRCIINSK